MKQTLNKRNEHEQNITQNMNHKYGPAMKKHETKHETLKKALNKTKHETKYEIKKA